MTTNLNTTPKRKIEEATTEDPKAVRARTTSIKLADYVHGDDASIDEEPIKTSQKTFEVEVRSSDHTRKHTQFLFVDSLLTHLLIPHFALLLDIIGHPRRPPVRERPRIPHQMGRVQRFLQPLGARLILRGQDAHHQLSRE